MALVLALKRLLSSNLFSGSFRPVGGVAQPVSSRFSNTNGSDDRDVEIEWHPGCEAALRVLSPGGPSLGTKVPKWDWNGGKLRFCADMTGILAKENLKVSVEQKILLITGEDKMYRYTTSIDLTSKLYQISDIKAEMMKNGVLRVFVPYINIDEETARLAASRTRLEWICTLKDQDQTRGEEPTL